MIGPLSWQASQKAPQFQTDVALLLSEAPRATVDRLLQANNKKCEVRMVSQTLVFPHWAVPLQGLSIIVWSDALAPNLVSSTMGIVGGCTPRSILEGTSQQVALSTWRSQRNLRQAMGLKSRTSPRARTCAFG